MRIMGFINQICMDLHQVGIFFEYYIKELYLCLRDGISNIGYSIGCYSESY